MSVAKVTEISATSSKSLEYPIDMRVTSAIDDQRRRFRLQEERLDEERAKSMTDEGGPPKARREVN